MTLRALLIGFASAFFIAGAGYINDRVLELESFNSGHLLPIVVLGVLFLFVVAVNPLLVRLKRSLSFRPSELAIIVALAMASCSIPGRGLMEQFTQCLVTPFHWSRVTPGWKDKGLLGYVPERAFVSVTEENYDETVGAYIMGAPVRSEKPAFWESLARKWDNVPWGAWLSPLGTWLPMVLLTGIASVALAMVVHRQWSSHEVLSYPVASFTGSLLEREPGRAFPLVFRNRLFWIGFGIVFVIRLNNGLYLWYPEYLIPVQLTWRLTPFGQLFPWLYKVQWGGALLRLNLFPLVAAFAFFLSSEVALTLGLSQFLWAIFALPMVSVGINLSTQYGKGGWQGWQRAGSYVAFALIMGYTGRQYYKETALRALAFWRRQKEMGPEVWAFRILVLSLGLLVFLACQLGLELPFAFLTVSLMMLTFLIVSRISAETGLFFIQPRWQPFGALLAFFGGYAMAPTQLVLSGLFCTLLCIDQSQGLMPYLINGLKICERVKLRPQRVARVTLWMYVVGVLLAVVIVLCANYHFGTCTNYNWSYQRVPTMPFRALETEVLKLDAVGALEEAEHLPWHQRFNRIMPKESFLWAAGFGFAAVLVFSMLRLRIPWWPLHPVMFLLWATYPMSFTCWSFLIGWAVKKAAVRFGGQHMAKKLKPLMIGIIAGEIIGALVFMVIGAVYYFNTGEKPISYRFFPR